MPGVCCFFYHSTALCCRIPMGTEWNLKKMLNRSYPVNLNATFLLKSAYLHRTHHHTLLMGNLNATSPELHYCLKYGCIRRWLSLQLRPTVAPPTLPAVLCRQPWPVLQPECPVAVWRGRPLTTHGPTHTKRDTASTHINAHSRTGKRRR